MLSNPSASSPKRLRIRGDELLRVFSGFLCYLIAYQLLPLLSPWTHPSGGQGLCLVPAPPVCTCLHRLRSFSCNVYRMEWKLASPAGPRGPVLQQSLRVSNTCIIGYFQCDCGPVSSASCLLGSSLMKTVSSYLPEPRQVFLMMVHLLRAFSVRCFSKHFRCSI